MKTFLSTFAGFLAGALTLAILNGQTAVPVTGGVKVGTYGIGFSSLVRSVDSSGFSASLAGLGAGAVSNGTHRYVLTYSDQNTPGGHETNAVKFTPAVTVVNNTINGQVAVLIPAVCDSNYPYLQVYRDKNGDGAFKFVGSENYACNTTFIDNESDSGLGALVPQTSTAYALPAFNGEALTGYAPAINNDGQFMWLGNPNDPATLAESITIVGADKSTVGMFGGSGSYGVAGGFFQARGGQYMGAANLTAGAQMNVAPATGDGNANAGMGVLLQQGSSDAHVASLPTCTTAGAGFHGVVDNASMSLTAGIGTVVAGGGANIVPVFCDGTSWRIG